MPLLDYLVFFAFLTYVIWDGTRRARSNRTADDYFLASRSVPWWAIGLSIMATQASAITMIGTTGQGWRDGMRFVQFYFALPLAMLILAFTAVPLYHRARVRTAYEYFGMRFDLKTRRLSALLFLVLRGLSVGIVIYAPSLVLAKVLGLPLSSMIVVMGGVAVVYTALGGLDAVIRTDVKQMAVILIGLGITLAVLLTRLGDEVGVSNALALAHEAGRLDILDFSWDPAEKYTIWSSLGGGLFLFLAYFGVDQSQVQRLLAGRSINHVRGALALNAAAKVPFQFLVLFLGVLLFAFYTLHGTPVTFEPSVAIGQQDRAAYKQATSVYEHEEKALRTAAHALAKAPDDAASRAAFRHRLAAATRARAAAEAVRGGRGDLNYAFLDFILHHLPTGLVGLLLAAIFAAALSSIDSEINAMATVVVVDLLPRRLGEGPGLLRISRITTLVVGAFATAFALWVGRIGSLIEAVNQVGSYLYGSLLGAFILAVAVPRANGHGACAGLLAGVVAVIVAAEMGLAFLYLNAVGTVTVVVVGTAVSLLIPQAHRPTGRRSSSGTAAPRDA